MIERLQPTLALLDQGLSLYRRYFTSFVLVAGIWFVPVAIIVGLAIAFGSQLDGLTSVALVLLGVLAFFVLMIYLVVALSKAAHAALDGEPLHIRAALRFEPLRLVGMSVFSIVYLIGAQIASTVVSVACICPLYILSIAVIGGLATIGGDAGSTGGIILILLIFGCIYAFGLFISGAVYGGLGDGLQAWAQERASFGVALQRGFELIFYRFWRNVVTWGFASLILVATGLAVAMTIGVALPLPLVWAFGSETPAVQAVSASAWLIGLVLVLPPLPIWMAILYRRNRTDREGAELSAQVHSWWQQHFPEVQSSEVRVQS